MINSKSYWRWIARSGAIVSSFWVTLAWAELPSKCRDLFANAGAVPNSADCVHKAILARGGMGSYTCTGNKGREYAQAYCSSTSTDRSTAADPPRVNSDALVKLGQGSAAEIFERVADTISFEPYAGNMRDPITVAMAKRANALDQTLLLRELLNQSGHNVRLVYGTLKPSAQQRLAASSRLVQADNPEQAATERLQARLSALLDGDHYWVEVQQDGRWLPLDPTFPDAKWGLVYGDRLGVLDSLPADKAQQVRLTLNVLTSDGKNSKLGQHSFRVTDLGQQAISLVISALPLAERSGKTPRQAAGGLGGALGGLAPSSGKNNDVAQQPTGKRYTPRLVVAGKNYPFKAYEALSAKERPQIVKEWLDIELILGKKVLRSTERVLFQSATDNTRPADQRHFVATVLTAFIDEDFVEAIETTYAEEVIAGAQVDKKSDFESIEQKEAQLAQTVGHSLSLSFAAESDSLTQALGFSNGVVFSHPLPRIYIVSTEGSWSDTQADHFDLHQVALDLRLDEVEAWPKASSKADATSPAQFGRGLQQSVLEGYFIESLPNAVPSVYTAAQIMEAADRADIQRITLFPQPSPEFKEIQNLPDSIKQHLKHTLAAGRHVVIPEAPVVLNGKPQWAWWDIDPTSGRLVGVVERGLHGAVMEYTILSKQVATDDQRGFVLGMLVGSMQTHMQLATALLGGESITDTVKARIEQTMKFLACASCFHTKLEFNLLSASGKINCMEVFKISFESVAKAKSMPFCEAYGKGFVCGAQAVLGGLKGAELEWNKPVTFESQLACGKL